MATYWLEQHFGFEVHCCRSLCSLQLGTWSGGTLWSPPSCRYVCPYSSCWLNCPSRVREREREVGLTKKCDFIMYIKRKNVQGSQTVVQLCNEIKITVNQPLRWLCCNQSVITQAGNLSAKCLRLKLTAMEHILLINHWQEVQIDPEGFCSLFREDKFVWKCFNGTL